MMMDDSKGGEKQLMEYLQTRQLLKERIRSKNRKESNDINTFKSTDNYGSFFGPSQPSISQRVIEESKLVEFQNMTTKFINSHLPDAKKYCSMNIGGTDKTAAAAALDGQVPVLSKIKMLNRDYSFLFSNEDVDDASAKQHPHDDHVKILGMKSVDESKKEINKSSAVVVSKQPAATHTHGYNKVLGKRRVVVNDYSKKENDQSTHVQYKQPDDHLEKAKEKEKELIIHQHKKPKLMPHDNHKVTMKTSHCDKKYPKGQPSKVNSLGAKSQINSSSSSSSSSEMKKKKTNHEPVVDYSSVIRKVFRYDKTKYGRDYDDDRAMVSNFADIQREEKRSERLGKKEDEEERILTEEMERKEKKLKQSKRRKLQAHQKD